MSILNPDDQGQNPTQPPAGGDQPATPPADEQPVSPPQSPIGGETAAASEKCVTCGNSASGGNCVACGVGEVTCTCQPQAPGGGTPPPVGEQPPGAPAV